MILTASLVLIGEIMISEAILRQMDSVPDPTPRGWVAPLPTFREERSSDNLYYLREIPISPESVMYNRLWELRNGLEGKICLAILDDEIKAVFGISASELCISGERLRHIFDKHKEVTNEIIYRVPYAIWNGRILRDGASFILYYKDPMMRRIFRLILKPTRGGTELWVSTVHRTNYKQVLSSVNRATLLRSGTLKTAAGD